MSNMTNNIERENRINCERRSVSVALFAGSGSYN
jgi:hypothetical protein